MPVQGPRPSRGRGSSKSKKGLGGREGVEAAAIRPVVESLELRVLLSVYNVAAYGADGSDAIDDTVAIRNAINAANNAAGANTVYFPAGTYLVNNIPITNITGGDSGYGASLLDNAPTDLTFEGDGPYASVLKRNPAYGSETRVLTVWNGSNLLFQDMGFDANNIYRWGGAQVRASTNITVQRIHAFDSNVRSGTPAGDRYMFGFHNSSCVNILDTYWEDLQLEIDDSSHVQVLRNLVERTRGTGAIGAWAVTGSSGKVFEDYLIQDNWIIDPDGYGGGIVFSIDNDAIINTQCRNIRVLDNVIIFPYPSITAKLPPAIKFGVGDMNWDVPGTIFDNITVNGNQIYVDPSHGDTTASSYIWFWTTYNPTYFNFDNTTVTNNTLYSNGAKPILDVRAYAKGDNWYDANNVKTAYVTPPPAPDPLATQAPAGELLSNGEIETDLSGWTVATGSGESVVYDTAQSSPFTNAYSISTGSAKLVDATTDAAYNTPTLSQMLTSPVDSGTITFNFDFRSTSGGNTRRWNVELLSQSGAVAYYTSFTVGSSTTPFLYNGTTSLPGVSSLAVNTWYNVTMTIDLDANTVSGSLSDAGGVLGSWTGASYSSTLNLGGVKVRDAGSAGGGMLYVDNVSLAVPQPEPEMLTNGQVETSLSGWNVTTDSGESVVYDSAVTSPFTNAYPSSSGSAKLIDATTDVVSSTPAISQMVAAPAGGGIVTFNFDFRSTSGGNTRRWNVELLSETGAVAYYASFTVGSSTTPFLYDGTTSLPGVTSLAVNTWYNVTMTIDLDANTVSGSLSDVGGVLGTWTGAAFGPSLNLGGVKVRDAGTSGGGMLYLDNASLRQGSMFHALSQDFAVDPQLSNNGSSTRIQAAARYMSPPRASFEISAATLTRDTGRFSLLTAGYGGRGGSSPLLESSQDRRELTSHIGNLFL